MPIANRIVHHALENPMAALKNIYNAQSKGSPDHMPTTVIDILKKQSEPGDIHENTFLIVMGDHGQTTNGDHGGGTAEEVETSIFGMSLKGAPVSISSLLDSNSCRSNVDGENVCIGSIQQIDFAVTISALIGIPFPFGRSRKDILAY
ncbi:hypothetical protein ZOSMA_14G00340 [Zostera marina]|uniref:GPI ethanolamine phosphate transferase 3 n=1 Tax=Zostera marina TaxID=29655 RepID=A0A0K9PW66_ZOSMR|nr:hypothetical protein ZOSMA_14G00340 [Zostera marina]